MAVKGFIDADNDNQTPPKLVVPVQPIRHIEKTSINEHVSISVDTDSDKSSSNRKLIWILGILAAIGIVCAIYFYSSNQTAIQQPIPFLPVKERIADNVLEITGDKVNLRNGPGTTYQVILMVDRGSQFKILEIGAIETVKGKRHHWYRIQHQGESAWVFGAFTNIILDDNN
jgi:Bacterial SH3 domain